MSCHVCAINTRDETGCDYFREDSNQGPNGRDHKTTGDGGLSVLSPHPSARVLGPGE